jgi:hypothetical protein
VEMPIAHRAFISLMSLVDRGTYRSSSPRLPVNFVLISLPFRIDFFSTYLTSTTSFCTQISNIVTMAGLGDSDNGTATSLMCSRIQWNLC